MVSLITAPEEPVFAVGETNNISVSFADVLDEGELLTGVPTVVEVTTTDLTIDDKVVSTVVIAMGEHVVAAGKAVQFSVKDHLVANSPYTIKITVTTDSVPAQIKVRGIDFTVEGVT